jgi:hypothetical protein
MVVVVVLMMQNKTPEKEKWVLSDTATYKHFECFSRCRSVVL